MSSALKEPVARLRLVGKVEAVSYLLLLGVAMPLKYLAGQPLAVRIVGLAHGILFILLGILTLKMMTEHDWPLKKAAMVMLDAVVRLLPGVMGNVESPDEESFEAGLLEYPQYTRPAVWQGREVPEVLQSGNHARIRDWRHRRAEETTKARRPDLWARYRESREGGED